MKDPRKEIHSEKPEIQPAFEEGKKYEKPISHGDKIPENTELDRAFEASMDGTSPSVEYSTTERLKQGLAGERLAAEALAADGHKILDYKPDIKGTNQGGIDIVTMKDGVVYYIDNKAFRTGRNVSAVSALDKNFEQNKQAVLEKFHEYATDETRSPQERQLYEQAVEAILEGRDQKAVTTAAVAKDGKHATDISGGLKDKTFIYIETSPGAKTGGGIIQAFQSTFESVRATLFSQPGQAPPPAGGTSGGLGPKGKG